MSVARMGPGRESNLISFLNKGGTRLPVGIVHVDPKTKLVLIELPHEAETGANRLWVSQDQLDEPVEVFA